MNSYRFGSLLLGVFLLLPLSFAVQAFDDCPKKIAVIYGDVLLAELVKALKDTYSQLGCDVTIAELPGRRGVSHFNFGRVDGELYRLTKIEPQYTRPFSRSSVPLMHISNVLWLHPDSNVATNPNRPLGYLLGVAYQEEYMKNKNGRAFHTPNEMYEAYRREHISGFLASESSVNVQVKRMGLPEPIVGEVLSRVPIYHYVGAEFSPFMEEFSTLIEKTRVFEKIIAPSSE